MNEKILTVSAGDVIRCRLNEDEKDKSEQALVLYPSPGNAVEIIPFDGEKLISMIGGGIRVSDIIEIIDHLNEEDYVRLITRGKVGQEQLAHEIYNRQPIAYILTG